MSNMNVEVRLLAGTSILEACTEAYEKVSEWGVAYVSFDFNGIRVSIGRNSVPEETAQKFLDLMKIPKEDREFNFVI